MINRFTESFQKTIVRFDSLSAGKKADYERMQAWRERLTIRKIRMVEEIHAQTVSWSEELKPIKPDTITVYHTGNGGLGQ